MIIIKKIHYFIAYLILRYKKVEKKHAQIMAEQYIFFKYK